MGAQGAEREPGPGGLSGSGKTPKQLWDTGEGPGLPTAWCAAVGGAGVMRAVSGSSLRAHVPLSSQEPSRALLGSPDFLLGHWEPWNEAEQGS